MSKKIHHPRPLSPLWWYPACVVVGEGSWQVWVGGESSALENTTGEALPLNGSLVLGQEQDEIDGGYVSDQAFVGHVTGLTLWPEALADEEVERWSNCQQEEVEGGFPTPLLNWEDLK